MNTADEKLLTIAEYIELLNQQLKFYNARIVGEVTQVKIWSSGHVYFTLKDKESGAVLDCVMWKHTYALFAIKVEVGMELIASGRANIYAPSGRLSFVATSLELVGEGALKKAYETLKKKLTAEGIFSQERKRPIPTFPRRIGIITSKQGAVIHDFMNNVGKHGFSLTFINTRVEGQEALPDLYNALKTLKKKDLDVIVIMRGGGSLQSLAAFDAEMLVRQIASSPIPVIAAIGHHEDVPLAALAGDVMVSTPTAAANLLNSSWEQGKTTILSEYQRMLFHFTQCIHDTHLTLQLKQAKVVETFQGLLAIFSTAASLMPRYVSQLVKSLHVYAQIMEKDTEHILIQMRDARMSCDEKIKTVGKEQIGRSFSFVLKHSKERLMQQEKLIHSNSPLRQLSLGYSVLRNEEGKLIKSIRDVTIKQRLDLTTGDGTIVSQVVSVKAQE